MHIYRKRFTIALAAFSLLFGMAFLPVDGPRNILDDRLSNDDSTLYRSESLTITRLSEHVYLYTSFLNTQTFGRVACNGMIVVSEQEAIVFDTPADNVSSEELMVVKEKLQSKIVAVVATHFHADCIGGLKSMVCNGGKGEGSIS